jgi:hypothetical protein
VSNHYFCSECGEDQSQFDHVFYHCHDCGECVIFDPRKDIAHEANSELQCILCCRCVDGQILKSHPGWVRERVSRDEYQDPYAFIDEIDYNKELFEFIKARVDRNAKSVAKRTRVSTSPLFRQFFIDKRKASIIICPISKCREYCIETEGTAVVDRFLKHLKIVHQLTPDGEFIQKLTSTISYIRGSDKIQYRDPFFHVDYENLSQNLSHGTEGVK